MPLTPLRARKLEKMFSTLDLNGDGVIGRADFLRRVEGFARLRTWTSETPEYRRNVAYSLEEWRNLRETADIDENGTISFEEYLRFGDVFLSDRDAVRAYARGDVQLLFDAMDTDGDGKVTAAEYREYLEVCGVDTAGRTSSSRGPTSIVTDASAGRRWRTPSKSSWSARTPS